MVVVISGLKHKLLNHTNVFSFVSKSESRVNCKKSSFLNNTLFTKVGYFFDIFLIFFSEKEQHATKKEEDCQKE